MFVCSPLSSEPVAIRFSTGLGQLMGEFDPASKVIRSFRFCEKEEEIEGVDGSLLDFLVRHRPIRLLIAEQPFFQRVYEELSEVPAGQTLTYGELARRAGRPGAARAVGQALAHNPICLLIPCHRIRPASGEIGNYRWGVWRKEALLELESGGRDAWEGLG